MELLLSRERVLDILNDKMFPNVALLTSGICLTLSFSFASIPSFFFTISVSLLYSP
jgi:hypothetical protein